MNKSRRIETAKAELKLGRIHSYDQLVNELPYTTVAAQAHIDRNRLFLFFYVDVLQMKLSDMIKVANVLQVDVNVINNLVMKKMERNQKRNSKK